MKKIIIIFLITILIYIGLFIIKPINKKQNIIKDLTFTQIEDKNTPLNYKKKYTFIIKELSGKDNSLQFNIINHYVQIFIDNKLIYELKNDTEIKKNKLIKIPLSKKDINKKVKIILTPVNADKIDNNLDLKIK